MNIKKVCVITGSRAEYGLLKLTISEISKSDELDLQLIVTGSHLSESFGNTFKEIEQDGFRINKKLRILTDDESSLGILKSISDSTTQFAEAYQELMPDLVLVLGDRYEIFSASYTAYILRIPIAHIHGGEKTEGAYDEAFRHSITKMSRMHFVSTEEYRKRVIQLGESPEFVFNYGAPGVEALKKIELYTKENLENKINLRLKDKNVLITYHPETLNQDLSPKEQINQLLHAIQDFRDINFIFTKANADSGGITINNQIEKFVNSYPNAYLYSSLGQMNYLSLLPYVDGVIGNSSSGIIEVPSFNIPTINIGRRQEGRISAESVINVSTDSEKIKKAIEEIYEKGFYKDYKNVTNPYDGGETSKKIINEIKKSNCDFGKAKSFYDLHEQ
ncbi:MAG: UDP-N-acetylglucosamine 2-epimerase [Gammaproteobacteria bacterium]|nr:UDP-N-acetylglucosamine 2-epimerase [Gammaproteobacteria bacterium]